MTNNIILFTIILYYGLVIALENPLPRLESAIHASDDVLKFLRQRWEIDAFPNFLMSPIMSHTSWQVLKLKFEHKILTAILDPTQPTTFVMSFMGSSVAAGHDSPYNLSYPILASSIMKSAFSAAGIDLISRNLAIGNNPCIPYDICPRTFAGDDADLIHWEQTYNCNSDTDKHNFIFEQFIRQSMTLPSSPVIIFSESIIPNWDAKDCQDPKNTAKKKLSRHEMRIKSMLDMSPSAISSSLNRLNTSDQWNRLSLLATAYKTAGIQFWTHRHYVDHNYKCKGPYVATWGCCSAPWHPSILGHELVASHFSYFWILMFKDALSSIHHNISNITSLDNNDNRDTVSQRLSAMKDIIDAHIHSEARHLPAEPLYPSKFIDGIRCYTTFQPRTNPNSDLLSIILTDHLSSASSQRQGFAVEIYENITRPDIIELAKSRGYMDYKYMLYGNNESLPLHIYASVRKAGSIFLCQPPSNWEKHPPGFGNLWDLLPALYITPHVDSSARENGFSFDTRSTDVSQLPYQRAFASLEELERLCIEVMEMLPIGNHVLTLKPRNITNIMISYVLIP